jgi:hypothetical protein
MKTLKQIREEYDSQFLDLVESLPDELMLEGSETDKPRFKMSRASPVPSSKEMPVMLIFRRVQYRVFPKGQVVALYFSNTVNKYLSIPFGKDGNLNLSESVIMDESEAWQRKEGKNPEGGLNRKGIMSYRRANPGSKLSMAVTTPPSKLKPGSKAANRRKSFCARMGGMPGPMKDEKGRPTRKALSLRKWNCEESFQSRLSELRENRLNEDWKDTLVSIGKSMPGYEDKEESKKEWKKGNYWKAIKAQGRALGKAALTGAGVAAGVAVGARVLPSLAGAAAGALPGAIAGAAKTAASPVGDMKMVGQSKASRPDIQKKSSWQKAQPKYGATTQSKLGQADLAQARSVTSPRKQVAENKISDIRNMVGEGIESKDLHINGRTVTLNSGMAKRILEVYDSVNTKNKKIVEGMLNEDLESFKRLLNFSIKA